MLCPLADVSAVSTMVDLICLQWLSTAEGLSDSVTWCILVREVRGQMEYFGAELSLRQFCH